MRLGKGKHFPWVSGDSLCGFLISQEQSRRSCGASVSSGQIPSITCTSWRWLQRWKEGVCTFSDTQRDVGTCSCQLKNLILLYLDQFWQRVKWQQALALLDLSLQKTHHNRVHMCQPYLNEPAQNATILCQENDMFLFPRLLLPGFYNILQDLCNRQRL